MFRATILITFNLVSSIQGEGSQNLAWELTQGFISVWNYTDQWVCLTTPRSAEEGIGMGKEKP